MGEKIRGVFAPVPTPFKDDGALDGNGWEKNITLWSASPLDGIVIAGSNGEIPFLSLEEREFLTRTAKEGSAGRLHIMAGAHFPSTDETIKAAGRLAAAGADSILLLPPHYYKGKTRHW